MLCRVVILLCLAAFLLCIIPTFSSRASAQAGLGTVDTPAILEGGCPTNRYFYSDPKMVCYTTTVRSCPNADPLDLVYGVDQPAAAPTYNGTIVMFAGDGGTYAGPENGAFDTYAAAYLAAGYQIIQVAWGQTYPRLRLGVQQRQ
jgi:hypothetical protein